MQQGMFANASATDRIAVADIVLCEASLVGLCLSPFSLSALQDPNVGHHSLHDSVVPRHLCCHQPNGQDVPTPPCHETRGSGSSRPHGAKYAPRGIQQSGAAADAARYGGCGGDSSGCALMLRVAFSLLVE